MNITNNFTDEQGQPGVNNKTILITGGTAGIGRATALLLAQQGAKVFIVGHNPKHLEDALQEINEKGIAGSIAGITADMGTNEGVQQVFKEIDQRFDKLDIVINNAALAYLSIVDGKYEEWEHVVKTNLLGYMACTWHAVDRMRGNKAGHIVNIGSMSADVREQGSSVYVGTKAGIQGFSEALRKEVNELGIKVTLIEPGAVVTEMQELNEEEAKQKVDSLEMMTGEDVARSVLYAVTQPERCDVVEMKIRPHLQLI